MSHAKGQYIWFMDPDDYVEATVLEEVYKALQENPAELTIIGHKEEYYDRDGKLNYTHEIRPRRQFFSSQQKMREHIIYLEQETIYGYAWNKFYSLEHITKRRLQYETVRLIEDIVFNISVLYAYPGHEYPGYCAVSLCKAHGRKFDDEICTGLLPSP